MPNLQVNEYGFSKIINGQQLNHEFCLRKARNCFVNTSNCTARKHVIFSCKLNILSFLEIRESKFALNHLILQNPYGFLYYNL